MIRVELTKMLRRPRTWITIALLNALPLVVAVLLAVTDLGPQPGEGPAFLSAVLTDGTLYPLAALAIVLPTTGWIGFTVAAALLVLAVGLVVWSLVGGRPSPAPVSPDAPTTPVGPQWT